MYRDVILTTISVTRMDYIWKILVTIFWTKKAQIFGNFSDYLKDLTF